ncbi:MAG: serine protease [Pseudomonadota bacterium]
MNLSLRLCAAALLLVCGAAQAAPLQPDLSQLESLPLHLAPPPVLPKVEAPGEKGAPLRVAVKVPLALSLLDGVWDEPEAGTSRWRTRVYSSGAKSLALAFSQVSLPEGAGLWLYDQDGKVVQGPYTAANRNPDGRLWTAIVPADTAVLELRLPSAQKAKADLQLANINYGTRDFEKAALVPGNAGSCNIDVACAAGDNHRNEIRAVGVYTVEVGSNVLICTGQLINNFRQDSTPYFLTANHCGVTGGNANSVMLYWNFQRSTCGTGTGGLMQSQSGAIFRAADSTADFTLLQLASAPSGTFNVYHQGFDASNSVPQSGIAIHHPQGDEKKISVFTAPATQRNVTIDGRNTDAWEVFWTQGTTEQGSSGGGLINQSRRLVGVLSGGAASCDDSSTPVDERTLPDYFGRLSRAWQASTTSGSGQLKAWLDPDNSGALSLCGQNPGNPCDASLRTSGSTAPGTIPGTVPGTTPPSNGSGAFGQMLLGVLALATLLRRRLAKAAA